MLQQLRDVHPLPLVQNAKERAVEKLILRREFSTVGDMSECMPDVIPLLVIATTTTVVIAGGFRRDASPKEAEALKRGSMPMAGGTGPASTITAVATASAIGSLEKSNAGQSRGCTRQVAHVVRSLRLLQWSPQYQTMRARR